MKEISITSDFDSVWNRISGETGLKSLRQLAVIIEKRQPTISAAKAKGEFPPGWAYLVDKKYGLLTEWIMTGEGPKRLEERTTRRELTILDEFEEWSQEEIRKNPERKVWLEIQLLDSFEKFKKWKLKRDEKKGGESGHTIRNVA